MKSHSGPINFEKRNKEHKAFIRERRGGKTPLNYSYDKGRNDDNHTLPEIDQITDKVYLGNYEAARFKDMLKIRGITHILVIGKDLEPLFTDEFVYLIIPVRDCRHERLDLHFNQCFEFIERAKKCFIHCRLGVSRSATITIAYLMWKYNMKLDQSLTYVENRRSKINPNEGFIKQLKHLEKELLINNAKESSIKSKTYKSTR